MLATRLVAAALLCTYPLTLNAQAVPPEMARSPQMLLAARGGGDGEPVDDSDLKNEETIQELDGIEIAKDSWSVPAAIGLSAIPGGGFGLIYARNGAAAVVPFLVSAAGYTVGALYMVGMFDTKKKTVCLLNEETTVDNLHCAYALHGNPDPIKNDTLDNHSIDPNTGKPYYQSGSAYTETARGENFEGQKTGIYILAGTYVVTTLLGAVWSALTVSDHNEEVRKTVESTAKFDASPKPVAGYDGQSGFLGLTWGF